MTAAPRLELRRVSIRYPVGRRLLGGPRSLLPAVAGVDLRLPAGETLALVGESGCGKTSLGRSLVGLVEATGEAWFRPGGGDPELDAAVRHHGRDGAVNLLGLPAPARKVFRRAVSLVFQDPWSSLDPRMRAWRIVAEPLEIHRLARGAKLRRRADALLERVGLDPALGDRRPQAFSGGQRQRLGIARALAAGPRLMICDEAVSALDVSVQAQVLELLARIQREEGLSVLFITHDLSVVRQVAHRTAVMYLGRIVEEGPTAALFGAPRHPYTRALLAAVPVADPGQRRPRLVLPGEPPSPADPPPGCPFHPRCPEVFDRCRAEVPAALPGPDGGRAACFLAEEGRAAAVP